MKTLLSAVVLSAVVLGQTSPPQIGSGYALFFTPPTQDVNNGSETVASIEVAIAPSDADLNTTGVALRTQKGLDPAVGSTGWPLATFIKDLPTAHYKIWVRALDPVGNASVWTAYDVSLDVIPPKPVTGISCRKI